MAETGDTACAPSDRLAALGHGAYVTSTQNLRTFRVIGSVFPVYNGLFSKSVVLVCDNSGAAWEILVDELRAAHAHEALAFRLTERRD